LRRAVRAGKPHHSPGIFPSLQSAQADFVSGLLSPHLAAVSTAGQTKLPLEIQEHPFYNDSTTRTLTTGPPSNHPGKPHLFQIVSLTKQIPAPGAKHIRFYSFFSDLSKNSLFSAISAPSAVTY
jgi:hypothetical protein